MARCLASARLVRDFVCKNAIALLLRAKSLNIEPRESPVYAGATNSLHWIPSYPPLDCVMDKNCLCRGKDMSPCQTPVHRPHTQATIRTHMRQWTYAVERRWLGDCQASVLRLFCVMLFNQRTKISRPTRFFHAVTVSLLPPSNKGYGCNHRTSEELAPRRWACPKRYAR